MRAGSMTRRGATPRQEGGSMPLATKRPSSPVMARPCPARRAGRPCPGGGVGVVKAFTHEDVSPRESCSRLGAGKRQAEKQLLLPLAERPKEHTRTTTPCSYHHLRATPGQHRLRKLGLRTSQAALNIFQTHQGQAKTADLQRPPGPPAAMSKLIDKHSMGAPKA